ncbi:MAG: glycoside hydrolase family 127 protein [Armatimonadota bacterium]
MNTPDEQDAHPLATSIINGSSSPCMPLQPLPVKAVELRPGFWSPRQAANVEHGIPHLLALMERHGIIDNFRRLSGRKDIERRGPRYTDSDLYKWLEAVGFVLQTEENDDLQSSAHEIIDEIVAVQQADEYINTYYVEEHADERYDNLKHSHELYCAGHLIQAAVAHRRASGTRKLLTAACRFADHICDNFGPGKIETTDGHPEIELALIELYRETGRQRYLDMAGFFLDQPQSMRNLPPIGERSELVDHCVRSGYICSAATDYYAETGDEALLEHLRELWADLVEGKIYITGGVGARYDREAFGEPYELPNSRAYAETCAAIAHMMWAWRMLLVTGEAQFADVMERILYNGFLSGVSLEGTEYFYRNPLASDGGDTRSEWYSTTCCPPNVQRTLASLSGYMVSASDDAVWMHVYAAMEARVPFGDNSIELNVDTEYPWAGDISITVIPDSREEFSLMLRIPEWAEGATASVNGEPVDAAVEPGSFLAVSREWQSGDTIELRFPMPVRVVHSSPRVEANTAKVALMRGPIVYCFEGPDNPRVCLADMHLPAEALDSEAWEAVFEEDLLGGVVTLAGTGAVPAKPFSDLPLYAPAGNTGETTDWESVQIKAIPYYTWANRGPASMRVWVPVMRPWD